MKTSGSPDEMRAFIARLYDLSLLIGHPLNYPTPFLRIYPGSPSNHWIYKAQFTYREENQNSFNVLARKTSFSQGAKDMTAYYGIEAAENIKAGSAGYSSIISAVGQWIESNLP